MPGAGLFQHLLVAALHRAVALEEVNAVALLSAKTSISDGAAGDVALDQHAVVAERGLGLALA